jgi:hypothetical protein
VLKAIADFGNRFDDELPSSLIAPGFQEIVPKDLPGLRQ